MFNKFEARIQKATENLVDGVDHIHTADALVESAQRNFPKER